MKRVVHDLGTDIFLTDHEAKEICKVGQGEECCAFVAVGGDGFQCMRMSFPTSSTIIDRLKKGTMTAKGKGGWKGCAWEGQGWDERGQRDIEGRDESIRAAE